MQAPSKSIQTAAASPTEAGFPTGTRKKCVAIGDRLKLLVSIALGQTARAQKTETIGDEESSKWAKNGFAFDVRASRTSIRYRDLECRAQHLQHSDMISQGRSVV